MQLQTFNKWLRLTRDTLQTTVRFYEHRCRSLEIAKCASVAILIFPCSLQFLTTLLSPTRIESITFATTMGTSLNAHKSTHSFSSFIRCYFLGDSESWVLRLESVRSSWSTPHESGLEDFSNKPRAEEHVALTIASAERLNFPTKIPNTWKKV